MTIYQKNAEQLFPSYVSKFIHEKYSPDDETALINNYLADAETYGADYAEYQAYRQECKDRAKRELGLLQD